MRNDVPPACTKRCGHRAYGVVRPALGARVRLAPHRSQCHRLPQPAFVYSAVAYAAGGHSGQVSGREWQRGLSQRSLSLAAMASVIRFLHTSWSEFHRMSGLFNMRMAARASCCACGGSFRFARSMQGSPHISTWLIPCLWLIPESDTEHVADTGVQPYCWTRRLSKRNSPCLRRAWRKRILLSRPDPAPDARSIRRSQ